MKSYLLPTMLIGSLLSSTPLYAIDTDPPILMYCPEERINCNKDSDCASGTYCYKQNITATCCLPIDGTSCNNAADCGTDTGWVAYATGYEQNVTYKCFLKQCKSTISFRCAAGYYGSSNNYGTSGCTRCPSSGGIYGTSAAGSTEITSCYIPSGTSFSDSYGSGTYTSNCYYSN